MAQQTQSVLSALQDHADGAGHVRGTFADVMAWIGPEAAGWDIQLLMIRLKDDGAFHPGFYFTPLDFSVDLVDLPE